MQYKEACLIHRTILDKIWEAEADITLNPRRCHEIAYLTSKGLQKIGLKAEAEHGSYKDFYNFCQHSWVPLNGFIFDFHFEKDERGGWVSEYHDEVVRFFWHKWRYQKKDRVYELAEGIEDFAEKAFKSLKITCN